jgi:hypothetical protein
MKLIIWILIASLLVSTVYAGVLEATHTVGTGGTTFTLTWRQGCPTGLLGPNQCHPTLPWWCPSDSIGTTNIQQNCGSCGCAFRSGTYCDTADPWECQACDVGCSDVCLPGWISCSFDYLDGCNVGNVVCNYPAPTMQVVGYAEPTSYTLSSECEYRQGKYLWGIPNGDGTYRDCDLRGVVCAQGRRLRLGLSPAYTIGSIHLVCPGGHSRDGYGNWLYHWDIHSGYRCPSDSECTSGGADPTPSGCTGNHECLDVVTKHCENNKVYTTRAYGECHGGECYAGTPYSIEMTQDCSLTNCPPGYTMPMTCMSGECKC